MKEGLHSHILFKWLLIKQQLGRNTAAPLVLYRFHGLPNFRKSPKRLSDARCAHLLETSLHTHSFMQPIRQTSCLRRGSTVGTVPLLDSLLERDGVVGQVAFVQEDKKVEDS